MPRKFRIKSLINFPNIALVLMLTLVVAYTLSRKNSDKQFDVALVNNTPTLTMLISNNREAIIYAVHNGILNAPDYELVNKPLKEPAEWSLSAFKNQEDVWTVSLKTKKILPTYSCNMKIDISTIVTQEALCQYNK